MQSSNIQDAPSFCRHASYYVNRQNNMEWLVRNTQNYLKCDIDLFLFLKPS